MESSILIDVTALFDQYSTRGIGKYTKELLKRLIPMLLENNYVVNLCGFNNLANNLLEIGFDSEQAKLLKEKINFYSFNQVKPSTVSNFKDWKLTYKLAIEAIRPDIYFAPHFERGLPTIPEYIQILKAPIPKTLVMVHDVIPLVNNKFSSKSILHNYLKGRFYKKMFKGVLNSHLIITNSEYSKSDIIKNTGISSSKVVVAHLGVDNKFFTHKFNEFENKILNDLKLSEKKFFLYDSGLEPNKNTEFMLKVFANLKQNYNLNDLNLPDTLVITGGSLESGTGLEIKPVNQLGEKFLAQAQSLNCLDSLIATGRVSDMDLLNLFKTASAHFNFSSYEGFNLGPIQAMASGIPSIALNDTVNPEVTAGGALLVENNDFQTAAKSIIEYLTRNDLNEILLKSKQIAEKYDWNTTAQKTFKAIESLKQD